MPKKIVPTPEPARVEVPENFDAWPLEFKLDYFTTEVVDKRHEEYRYRVFDGSYKVERWVLKRDRADNCHSWVGPGGQEVKIKDKRGQTET